MRKSKEDKQECEYIKMVNLKYNIIIPEKQFFSGIIIIAFTIFILTILSTVFIVETVSNKRKAAEQELLIKEMLDEKTSSKEAIVLHTKIGKAIVSKDNTIIQDSLLSYVDKLPFYFPEIIKAQIALESNYGTSNLAKQTNNLFGMKKVYVRTTTQESNDYNGYGIYKNYKLSIIDRLLWDHYLFKEKPSKKEYLKTLALIYAEDEVYIDKLLKIADNF